MGVNVDRSYKEGLARTVNSSRKEHGHTVDRSSSRDAARREAYRRYRSRDRNAADTRRRRRSYDRRSERRSRSGSSGQDARIEQQDCNAAFEPTAGEAVSDAGQREKGKLSRKKLQKLRNAMIEEKFGYTNDCNPFNDANLSAPFVWKRKQKFLAAAGRAHGKTEPAVFLEQTGRKIMEIESVKKRREAREEEERLLEEQQAILSRERELEHYAEWEAREDAFHREMASRRTDVRLRQHRERPADLMVKALRLLDGEDFDDLTLLPCYPHELFSRLNQEAFQTLIKDIRTHYDITLAASSDSQAVGVEDNWAQCLERMAQSLDEATTTLPTREALAGHLEFWKAMLLLGAEAVSQGLQKGSSTSHTHQDTNAGASKLSVSGGRDVHTGIAFTVLRDLDTLMSTKSRVELDVLEAQVKKKRQEIRSDPSSEADLTYWDTIMDKLPYYKAVAETRSIHDRAKSRVTQLLECRMMRVGKTEKTAVPVPSSNRENVNADAQHQRDSNALKHKVKETEPAFSSTDETVTMSPPLLPLHWYSESTLPMMTEETFWLQRAVLKDKLIAQYQKKLLKEAQERAKAAEAAAQEPLDGNPEDNQMYENFVSAERRDMPADEVVMPQTSLVPLPSTLVKCPEHWELKYRPRKPRFFNRVKTGYEWNKYNQTHYDRDNPPPKAVQGYKFNLFYPELIDKTKAPSWKLLPSDEPDTVLIQFHGGPPYEDVVFKIINREWDLNPRSGFRNSFDRGT